MIEQSVENNNVIRINAVGDISLGDHPVCFGHGIRSTIESKSFSFLFDKIRGTLSDAEILFGNLETVLPADTGSDDLRAQEMKGKQEYAAGLKDIGFNVMSVANNHAMQHGPDAFTQTVSTLVENDIHPVGIDESGKSNCFSYRKGNTEIAIISYSFRPEKYSPDNVLYSLGEKQGLLSHISQLRKQGIQVIVSVHWGEEYLHYPSIEQVRMARSFISSGACLILGHHPHVLQGIEEYEHGVIVYSLGNFIFDMWQSATRETIIFQCSIDETGIRQYDYIPIYVNDYYQPEMLKENDADKLSNKIREYSQYIKSGVAEPVPEETAREYMEKAEQAYKIYRLQCYLYFIRNIYKYKLSVVIDSFIRFVKRRIDPGHV